MSQTQVAESSGMESFAALFEESLKGSDMRTGEVISAEVVRVEHSFVVVNAGLKSEAYVPIEEFKNDLGELEVQVGDFVSVAIDAIENGYGDTILSRDKAKRLASWMSLETSLDSGEFVTGTVNGKVKGGLTVLVNGIRAFLPGSLLDTRPVKDMSPYEGKTMEFKVIKLDRKRNNVVLSRRAVVEASMGEERGKLLSTLHEGAIVNGVVKNITEYGAFVDLGGIDGLLHITDMAWRRVRHPSEVVQVGQELQAARETCIGLPAARVDGVHRCGAVADFQRVEDAVHDALLQHEKVSLFALGFVLANKAAACHVTDGGVQPVAATARPCRPGFVVDSARHHRAGTQQPPGAGCGGRVDECAVAQLQLVGQQLDLVAFQQRQRWHLGEVDHDHRGHCAVEGRNARGSRCWARCQSRC